MRGPWNNVETLDRVITIVVVIGEGASEAFRTGGVRAILQGAMESPCRWRAKVMDFIREDVLERYVERMRERHCRNNQGMEVLVLRGDDALVYSGLLDKAERASKGFRITRSGMLRPVNEGTSVRNARLQDDVFSDEVQQDGQPGCAESLETVYHDITDILYAVRGDSDQYVHEIKGEEVRWRLDFKRMRYWRDGGVEPAWDSMLPAYCEHRRMSFGAAAFLKVALEQRADILLDCSTMWTDPRLVLLVGRRFVFGPEDKVTTMYNFFAPSSGMLSPIWFNGFGTGRNKVLDNTAYIRTERGRQWYRIHYNGKVEKDRLEMIL